MAAGPEVLREILETVVSNLETLSLLGAPPPVGDGAGYSILSQKEVLLSP